MQNLSKIRTVCDYCSQSGAEDAKICAVYSAPQYPHKRVLQCTRLVNHDGPHVACGRWSHKLLIWDIDEEHEVETDNQRITDEKTVELTNTIRKELKKRRNESS